jgi:hypothetical protein
MNSALQTYGTNDKRPGITNLQIVLLLLPVWLVLFWFKVDVSQWIVFDLLSLQSSATLPQSLAFFISTLLKIFLLLILIIFLMALIRTWIPVEKIRDKLTGMPPLLSNAAAGALGVVSPFCSCSAIPVFISFLESGIPLGITFSFLIASPLVNEIILTMLFSLFGWKTALIYLVAGLIIAIIAGFIIDRLKLEKHLPLWILEFRSRKKSENTFLKFDERLQVAVRNLKNVLSRTWLYIVIGIAIGSFIHGFVPEDFIAKTLSSDKWYTLPLVVLTGIPLYACSAAVAPIAFTLVDKGLPLGIALAFIMSVAGLSLPEFVMLKKVLSLRLILIFVGTVFTGILIVGYFFNWIL